MERLFFALCYFARTLLILEEVKEEATVAAAAEEAKPDEAATKEAGEVKAEEAAEVSVECRRRLYLV